MLVRSWMQHWPSLRERFSTTVLAVAILSCSCDARTSSSAAEEQRVAKVADGVPDQQSRWTAAADGYVRTAEYGRGDEDWLGAVVGLAVAPDHDVFVYDGVRASVVVLTDELEFVRRIGRKGPGPGELYSSTVSGSQDPGIHWLSVTGSSVYAYDHRVIHVFSLDGQYRTSIRDMASATALPYALRSVQVDSQNLLYAVDAMDWRGQGERSLQTWRVSDKGHSVVFSVPLPPPPRIGKGGYHIGFRQARPLWASSGDCIYVSDGAGDWLMRYNLASRSADTIPLPHHPASRLSRQQTQQEKVGLLELLGAQGKAVTEVPQPSAILHWSRLAVDPDRYVWLQGVTSTESQAKMTFVLVVSPEGIIYRVDDLPAFPDVFGPPGVFYVVERDADTDEPIIAKYDHDDEAK